MNYHLPLGLTCFDVVRSRYSDCESVGLSKLPPSVICAARLHSLRRFSHVGLCQYIDVVREKPERLFVVSEAYSMSLEGFVGPVFDVDWLTLRLNECLDALEYLDQHHIVHLCLNPSNIMLNFNGNVKISGFGLYFATHWGYDVDFPIADPIYSAPEAFLAFLADKNSTDFEHNHEDSCPLHIVCDMWSLGLIFLELIYGKSFESPLHRWIHSQHPRSSNKSGSNLDSSNLLFTVSSLLEGLRLSKGTGQNLADFISVTSPIAPTESSLKTVEDVCLQCLIFDPSLRPLPCVARHRLNQGRGPPLLQSAHSQYFDANALKSREDLTIKTTNNSWIPPLFHDICQLDAENTPSIAKAVDFLSSRSDIAEVYYYWRLTGGNLKSVWEDSASQRPKSQWDLSYSVTVASTQLSCSSNAFGVQRSRPPILRLPHYLSIVYHPSSSEISHVSELWPTHYRGDASNHVSRIILLPFHRLLERISMMSLDVLYPLLICSPGSVTSLTPLDQECSLFSCGCLYPAGYICGKLTGGLTIRIQPINASLEDQPNSVKASDIEYQIRRVCLFKRLLNGLPVTEVLLRLEARKDIPPLLRPQVWAALLGVHRDNAFRERYAANCVSTAGSTVGYEPATQGAKVLQFSFYGRLDEKSANQIAVDLPRCHAYDALLASPSGHASLRQVLVSTLSMQPSRLEYTQGMDSVAAVFVRLFYPDEALAAACLQALFSAKLSHFFAVGQFTAGLQAFFNVLLRLFAFHAPTLAVCLTELNVPLVGLTTGWIYTLFAHAMPLDRTEVIWDTLIAGPPSLPMFFYIAVFLQLDQQINFESIGLEKICTVLSNFPDIDLDKCRSDALRFAVSTPISLTLGPGLRYRFSALHPTKTTAAFGNPSELIFSSHSRHANSGAPTDDTVESESAEQPPSPRCCSSFYERLCTPNAWPCHLELGCESALPPNGVSPSQQSSVIEPCNIWVTKHPLVSLLSPEDALEHLLRPDCFVLDVRDQLEFSRGFIAGCVHRLPTQLPLFDPTIADSSAKPPSTPPHSLLGSDWEFVEGPSGSRRNPCVIHPFLVDLSTEPAWVQASEARREATVRQSQTKRVPGSPNSPGLIIIVGSEDVTVNEGPVENPISILLGSWLIHRGIDRVCVLNGGAPALLRLSSGSGLFVCPAS